ncbi:MAG: 4-alpha-glucanotransferase [Candidatus Ancaeobacter aquaticus]|nr:4-alpha-glucanotransferase [Candidatus Ancaeobacter aquaticus]
MVERSDLLKRRAGIAIPLFSLNEKDSWGIGEIGDVYSLIDWLAETGQSLLQILPFNEMAPGENSPYSALSIFAIDPVYISIDKKNIIDQKDLKKCNKSPIPYTEIRNIKLGYLKESFKSFKKSPPEAFSGFLDINSWWLHDYALFRVLKEKNNWYSWTHWPQEYKDRNVDALEKFAKEESDLILFQKYVQWVAWEQWVNLRKYAESKGVLLKGDVPFAPCVESDVAWVHREIIDPNFTLGAPPDAFSADGQKWGLPVYHIGHMEEREFSYWRARAQWADRLFHIYRIDHVVGCYRMYAFPEDKSGEARFIPEHEDEQLRLGERIIHVLLDESKVTYPIAEDLGVIPDFVRESLARLQIPGYKIFRWERYWNTEEQNYIDPKDYSEISIATTSTHDTDTLSQWWKTVPENEKNDICAMVGVTPTDKKCAFSFAIHMGILNILYRSNSIFSIIPIQDLFGWKDVINVPGTVSKNNWSWRLPGSIQNIIKEKNNAKCLKTIDAVLNDSGRKQFVAAR